MATTKSTNNKKKINKIKKDINLKPDELLRSTQDILNHIKKDMDNMSLGVASFINRQTEVNKLMNSAIIEMANEIKKYKKTNQEPEFIKGINNNYTLKCTIQHFDSSEKSKQLFFEEIQKVMIKHGVFRIDGTLLKKF